jgi:hypothetical protein
VFLSCAISGFSSTNFAQPIFSHNLFQNDRTLPKITDKVYFEISIDDEPSGKIVFGLFGEAVPRTAENFKRLCACDAGKGELSGVDLCYKNTPIHRISKLSLHTPPLPVQHFTVTGR